MCATLTSPEVEAAAVAIAMARGQGALASRCVPPPPRPSRRGQTFKLDPTLARIWWIVPLTGAYRFSDPRTGSLCHAPWLPALPLRGSLAPRPADTCASLGTSLHQDGRLLSKMSGSHMARNCVHMGEGLATAGAVRLSAMHARPCRLRACRRARGWPCSTSEDTPLGMLTMGRTVRGGSGQ